MDILIYSDEKYEYQVKYFLRSVKYAGLSNSRILYYNIGFNSSINQDNVINIPWEKSKVEKRFEFYKPGICLDALKYSDRIAFFDTDIILSRRFSKLELIYGLEHPIFCTGPIDYPNTYWADHTGKTEFNERKFMDYLGIENRTMNYIMTCFFTYDKNASDFIEEWKSFCENEYLLKNQQSYFPFPDETIANVLLWKRRCVVNYGRRFVNTHKFTTFKLCEESNNIKNQFIDENIYEQCEDSNTVYFYHGTKVNEETSKILDYINENS